MQGPLPAFKILVSAHSFHFFAFRIHPPTGSQAVTHNPFVHKGYTQKLRVKTGHPGIYPKQTPSARRPSHRRPTSLPPSARLSSGR